ncbi:MAG: SBBP repeat-containing protein, partial [Acidobacteria bacterium]|nr:SBBP repeat-containing protein [Acidobacteriota bacterium]
MRILSFVLSLAAASAMWAQPALFRSNPVTYFLGRGEARLSPVAVASGPGGDIWVGGVATGNDLPTVNAIRAEYESDYCGNHRTCGDLILARLKADGSGAVFSTYIGGLQADELRDMAVDEEGNAYLVGLTNSPELELYALSLVDPVDPRRAFLMKVSPAGEILYAASLPTGIPTADAVDADGAAYVAGRAFDSLGNATVFHTSGTSGVSAFVMKVNAQGTSIDFASVLGGDNEDIRDIALGEGGRIFVTGTTSSLDFPATASFGSALAGEDDNVFLAVLSPGGDTLEFAASVGGSGDESAPRLAVAGDTVVLAGTTDSLDFPSEGALTAEAGERGDYWAAAIDWQTQMLRYCGYVGRERAYNGVALA